jgi:integrase
MGNSIKPAKPSKPYAGFPLFPHATGRWCKKIRGKSHYFGRWDDPDAALQKYLDEKDDLHAGRTPRRTGDGLTIADLCNQFLNTKRRSLDAGEIADRSFRAYYDTCAGVVEAFGKNRLVDDLSANDFELFRARLAESFGPVALGNEIGRVRMIFKYGYDQSLIDKPIRYGQSFQKPSRKVLRIARSKNGPRMFEADELRTIIDAARLPFKAMTLLAINCGFGQSDLASLPQSAVDLEDGWVDYPRQKTGVERRCPLWPETVAVLREAIEQRPKPKNESDAGLCFLTGFGNRWVRSGNQTEPGKRTSIDVVSKMFGEMLTKLDINGHRNFYALRHTFETIGGESKDQISVNAIMGHVDSSMAGVYRERISDERLRAVVYTVHSWLWPDKTNEDADN